MSITREFCQWCHRVSAIGFHVPDDVWRAVAPRGYEHSLLCLQCFAALGDEKHIAWDTAIEFYPCSYATLHALRDSGAA